MTPCSRVQLNNRTKLAGRGRFTGGAFVGSMGRVFRWFCLLMPFVVCGSVQAQEVPAKTPAKAPPKASSAGPTDRAPGWQATVGDWKIREERVLEFVDRRLGNRKVSDELLQTLRREALIHLVDRQVVLEYLKTTSHAAGKGQLALEQSALEDRLKAIGKSFEAYLGERKMTAAEWRNETFWRLSWRHFLEEALTPEALQAFFDQHRRQFDGTKMKVAHLLWQSDSQPPDQAMLDHARTIRQQIVDGDLTWSRAVQQESAASSSKKRDGEIGWIRWDGPMPPEFSAAAMRLDPGQISPPVTTRFGIHLIRCVEIKPGTFGPQDVESQIREGLTRELFHQLVEDHRSDFEIEMPVGF